MKGKLAISFPWLVFVFVTGAIIWDQMRSREEVVIDGAELASAPAADGSVAVDPVCGMTVGTGASFAAVVGNARRYFCSEFCRDEFVAGNATVPPPPEEGHTMRGIPTWMCQMGVAVVLVLSFGVFELFGRPRGTGAMEARIDLTSRSWLGRLIKWPPLRFAATTVTVFFFLLIVAAGLLGEQNPAMNIAPLLTWTIWWAGLVFLVLYLGKAWCYVCPWDAIATWIERLKFWGPRKNGLGLGLKWPKPLRNIWPAVALFILLTWIELGMGITMIPRATAWVALAMLGMAVVSVLLFDRKAFCRYGCLVGRVSGLYALFSSTELRAVNTDACSSCRTMDCFRGNGKGDGCPTFEFPRTMKTSTYCIMCSECMKTCPKDNIAFRLRPWGADLGQPGKPRADEAFLAIILLALTGFHGLTMTPKWSEWNGSIQAGLGIPEGLSFALLMAAIMVVPILLFWALSWLSSLWTRPHTAGSLFLRYAYALLPIALFYHLAHNAEHFLMEGPKVVAMASDPFGWGWNLFGTARMDVPPLITLGGLWWIQVAFILIGHVYGLWISSKITERLVATRRAAFVSQIPMLAAMVFFSVFSLWLLHQPMEMRLSAM